MREALRSRSTLLVVAALLAGGAGGFAIGRATDESPTPEQGKLAVPNLAEKLGVYIEAHAGAPRPVPKNLLERCGFGAPHPNTQLLRKPDARCPEVPPPGITTTEPPAVLREAVEEGRIHEDQNPDTYPPDVKQAIREYNAQKAP